MIWNMGDAHKCPVCGKYEFEHWDSLEICEYCGWQDDALETEREDYSGGANGMALKTAQAIFKRDGALTEWAKERQEAIVKASGPHVCPVCKSHTFPVWGSEQDCPVCGWIDDCVQTIKPDREHRINEMSLNQAREAYKHGEEVI